jgi:hypothetical protein
MVVILLMVICRNPSLGFVTKTRACKVAGQEGTSRIMLHAPGSAREYEGIDPHTPKGTPTLGIGVLVDSRMFKAIVGVKTQWIKELFISLESYWNLDV